MGGTEGNESGPLGLEKSGSGTFGPEKGTRRPAGIQQEMQQSFDD